MSSTTSFNLSTSRQVHPVRHCPKSVQTQPKNQVEWTRARKCCDASVGTWSLKRLANLECDLNDTAWPSLHCAFWVSCLALHHHQGTGTTPALVVMIATHDNVLIAQSAGSVGTNKQPECIFRRIGLCHAIARAHIQLAMAMHMFTRPVLLMRTGLLSSLVKCPGMVCPRDRSRYITDTRKNEGGNVSRNVCVNSVVCLSNFCSLKFQVHHSHVSNKMNMSLLAASVDMSGTFKVAVSITNIFFERSRGPFRGGVLSAFLQEQLHADATYHSLQLAQKKKNIVQPEIDRNSCAPQSRERLLFVSSC